LISDELTRCFGTCVIDSFPRADITIEGGVTLNQNPQSETAEPLIDPEKRDWFQPMQKCTGRKNFNQGPAATGVSTEGENHGHGSLSPQENRGTHRV
jgi:hypothetical protein